jgi:hypothetical protein
MVRSRHNPGLVIVIGTTVLTVLVATAIEAQSPGREPLVGCYELKVGAWTPPLGSAAQFSTPPDTVSLSADSTLERSLPRWHRAAPTISHAYSRGRERASWTALDSSSFRVLWSDGLTGADLRLFRGNQGAFFGVIKMLSDAIGPEDSTPKAVVVAKRVNCKASGPREPHNTR